MGANGSNRQLVTRSFAEQCLAFPDRVEQALATVTTVEEATDLLDKAAAMETYARRLKDGVEVARPVAFGVLKIKAKIGELAPAKPPGDRGQGRNGKPDKSSSPGEPDFARRHIAAYRKLARFRDKLDAYYESIDDVPSQTDFFRHVQQAVRPQPRKPGPLPSGTYRVLYADPPWRYDFSSTESRRIENQYPTMEVDEICGLPVGSIAAPDSVLFLWATAPKLCEALLVMESWEFEYKTHAVWDKQRLGMGYWFRGQHELLLVGTRGSIPPPEESDRKPSVIRSPRGKHSAKPESVYELIEAMYPKAARVEMFCRKPRDGWDAWGDMQ